ncbi:hypothetical protein HDU67_004553 [Dinochytrium kinnereticum]|nr:hypothetical protein HDU67_004553 [Dinochytrium kinnereticum]
MAVMAAALVVRAAPAPSPFKDMQIYVSLEGNSSSTVHPNATSESFVPRPCLNTGPPPEFDRATGTAIFRGQSSAIRFTSPSDAFGGSRLLRIELVLRGGSTPSRARLSVVDDSGFNSPSTTVLETRTFQVPRYDGRITVKAESNGNLILYPGEIFWVILEGDARYVTDAFSWLDSDSGLAWTAFRTSSQLKTKITDSALNLDKDSTLQHDVQSIALGAWVVEKSRGASSTAVYVS